MPPPLIAAHRGPCGRFATQTWTRRWLAQRAAQQLRRAAVEAQLRTATAIAATTATTTTDTDTVFRRPSDTTAAAPICTTEQAASRPDPQLFQAVQQWLRLASDDAQLVRPASVAALARTLLESTGTGDGVVYMSLALSPTMGTVWLEQMCAVLPCWMAAIGADDCTMDDATDLLHALALFTEPQDWPLVRDSADSDAALTSRLARIRTALFSRLLSPACDMHRHLGAWLSRACLVQCRDGTVSGARSIAAAYCLSAKALLVLGKSDATTVPMIRYILSAPLLASLLADATRLSGSAGVRPGLPDWLEPLDIAGCCVDAIANATPATLSAVLERLDANQLACLLGNVVQLLDSRTAADRTPASTRALTLLFARCRAATSPQPVPATATSTYHPLFGWCAGSASQALLDAMPRIAAQLQRLWHPSSLWAYFSGILRHGAPGAGAADGRAVLSPGATADVVGTCVLFTTVMDALPRRRTEILSAIAYADALLPSLWRTLWRIGPHGRMRVFLNAAAAPDKEPLMPCLVLFCDAASHLLMCVVRQRPRQHTASLILRVRRAAPSRAAW